MYCIIRRIRRIRRFDNKILFKKILRIIIYISKYEIFFILALHKSQVFIFIKIIFSSFAIDYILSLYLLILLILLIIWYISLKLFFLCLLILLITWIQNYEEHVYSGYPRPGYRPITHKFVKITWSLGTTYR